MNNNNKSADDHHPDHLYQQYRAMPAATDTKIDMTVESALACRAAMLSNANRTPAFYDIDAEFNAEEHQVLNAYREFQSMRGDSVENGRALDDDIARVMSNVTPLIRQRAPEAKLAAPRTSQQSWAERLRERVTGWTAPLGAVAMAAVAAVAIALFSATDPVAPSLGELNGIAAYEQLDGLNLSKSLDLSLIHI